MSHKQVYSYCLVLLDEKYVTTTLLVVGLNFAHIMMDVLVSVLEKKLSPDPAPMILRNWDVVLSQLLIIRI